MKLTLCPFCGLLLLWPVCIGLCLGQSDSDWPGWRGLGAQGTSELGGPIKWSVDSSNIRWKTNLPGEGHSSPVVVENKVVVTAACPVTHGQQVRQLTLYGILGLAIGLALSSVPYLLRCCRRNLNKAQFCSVWLFCMLLGVFIYALLLLASRASATDHRSRYIMWVLSYMLGGIGVVLAITGSPRRSARRILLGILPFLLAWLLIWFRPQPEYYYLTVDRYHLVPTYTVLAVLASIGIASILGIIRKRPAPCPGTEQQADGQQMRSTFLKVGLAWACYMCGLIGFGAIIWVPLLIRQGWFSLPPNILYMDSISIGGCAIAVLIWCAMQTISKKLPAIHPHSFFSFGVLCLAGLAFIAANYVGTQDQYVRAIVCVDRYDGTIKWICKALAGPKEKTHRANSAATPTPVIHNQRVYAYFGSPGLMCADLEGNLIWSNHDLPYEGIHGVGASPIACDGYIFITSLNSKAPYIAALDCSTGERIWTTKIRGWSGIHGEHRTPLIVSSQGKKVVVNWCRYHNELTAYDVRSGQELWKCQPKGKFAGESVASILWSDGMLYLPSRSDIAAIRLSLAGETALPTAAWNTDMRGKGPVTPSPVLSNGMLFMVSDHGYASCLSASDGELLWQERLPPGEYLASPIVMGDHVYFWNTSGVTTVVACDRTFKKIAQNTLPGGIYASPAPVDGQLFVRTTEALWCIE